MELLANGLNGNFLRKILLKVRLIDLTRFLPEEVRLADSVVFGEFSTGRGSSDPRPVSPYYGSGVVTCACLFHIQVLASVPPAMYLDVGGHPLLIQGALF